MNFLPILYLCCLMFASIKSAPTESSVTLYDAIAQKCPSVKNVANFQKQPLFKACSDWKNISQIQKLEDSTKTDVLCLLYYHSFTEYCSNTLEVNTNLSISLTIEVEKVCDNLDIIPKQTELGSALQKIIATKEHCKELCDDGFGYSVGICSMSYYYNHLFDKRVTATDSNHLLKVPPPIQKSQLEPLKEQKDSKDVIAQSAHQTDDNQLVKDTVKEKVETKINDVPQNTDVQDQLSAETPQSPPDKSLGTGIIDKTPGDNSNNNNNDLTGATNNNAQKSAQSDVNSGKEKENIEITSEKRDPSVPDQEKTENQNKLVDIPTLQKDETDPNPSQNIQPENNDQDNILDGSDINHVADVPENIESGEDPEQPQDQLNEKPPKPVQIDETEAVNFTTEMDGDSYFFTYFMLLCVIFIVGYVCYHNKQKLLALILEGRRGKRQYRGRRPNSNNYHKLDSNLEEAITSSCNKNTNNVIY